MADLRTYPLGVGPVATRVIEAGRQRDPAVVFLHGMGARADRWTLNLGPVAEHGFRALALDLPGHGFATKGELPDYSVDGYTAFVLGALQNLDIEIATFVGTSLGAHIAGAIACQERSAVNDLILVGALGLVPVGPERCERMAVGLGRQTPDAIREKLRVVVGDQSIVNDSWVYEESMVNTSPGAQEGLARLANYVISHLDGDVIGPRLAALTPPVRVELVWGAIDRPVPLDVGREAADRFGWPMHVIQEAGHVPYRERRDQFNALLMELLFRS